MVESGSLRLGPRPAGACPPRDVRVDPTWVDARAMAPPLCTNFGCGDGARKWSSVQRPAERMEGRWKDTKPAFAGPHGRDRRGAAEEGAGAGRATHASPLRAWAALS